MAHPKLIGSIDGHRVYDSVAFRGPRLMSYRETFEKKLPYQHWTSHIFVERNPDEFCEIYRASADEDNLLDYQRAKVVDAGGRKVIASVMDVIGNGGRVQQAYFILTSEGTAVKLPMDRLMGNAIAEAIRGAGLKDAYSIRDEALVSIPHLWAASRLLKPTDAHCCPTGGSICITFRFVGDDLRVDKQRYDPDSETRWNFQCSKIPK